MQHSALLDLVPNGSETHRAVKSGSWFDASTWKGGVVPDQGARVYIPSNINVKVDGQSDARLWTIRVDGELSFSASKNTRLVLDTLAVMQAGQLNIGSKEQPVANGVTAEIIFADDNRALNDPMQMGLGLVSIGEVNIHGQDKRSHLKVDQKASKGDTRLKLADDPKGWRVGDRIVLTGTKYNPDWLNQKNLSQSQDEELVIKAIEGDVITIDKPLKYDHTTPRSDLNPYVANLSRNVIFRSDVTDDISQRGHVMLMASDNVDIRYAQFTELGRTDKSRDIKGSGNVNGRYSLHLHQQGVELDGNPAMIIGNSVEGSPGWGYVHHSSYAVMDHNVAYDVFGGAFIAESGDETGRWENNIAIKGTGIGFKGDGHPKAAHHSLKAANNGTGFYFQGRLVHNQGNVAASMPGFGFLYFHRPTKTSVRRVDSSTIESSQTARFKDYDTQKGVSIDSPSIQGFEGNTVFAAGTGLSIIKNNANQNHDNRSLLNDFTAWEVNRGASLEYTGHYTLNDFDLVSRKQSKYWESAGLILGQKMVDIVVNNLRVKGFTKGVNVSKINNFEGNDLSGNNLFIDYKSDDVDIRIDKGGQSNDHVLEKNSSELKPTSVNLALDSSSDLHIDSLSGQERIILRGTKTDSTGSHPNGFIESHANLQNLHDIDLKRLLDQGYYTLPDKQKAVILSELVTDRVSGQRYIQDIVLTVNNKLISSSLPNLGQLDAADSNKDGVWEINSVANADFDAVDVEMNKSVVFSVLDNDTDIDGDKIALKDFTDVDNGNLKLLDKNTGTFKYTPNDNHSGDDYFEYSISDPNGSGRTTTGRVQLKIYTALNASSAKPQPQQVPSITTVDSISVTEKQTAVLDVDATDADGDTEGNGLTYSLSGGVDQGSFEIADDTGVLNFTSAPNFDKPTDNNRDNIYKVEVSVTDSTGLTDTQLLNVTVGESTDNKGTDTDNEGTGTDNKDTDSVTGLQIGLYDADSDTLIAPLTEGRQISESDVAGKNLTISALVTEESSFFGQVESMFLNLNNGQATRKENAEPYALFGDRNGNFLEGGSISSGNNTISFDLFSQDNLGGELLDTVNVDFTILNASFAKPQPQQLPSITTVDSISVTEKQTAVLDVDATDADGDTEGNGLTYSLTGGVDQGSFAIADDTGVLSFSSAPDFDKPTDNNRDNIYKVEVSVTDSTGLTDTQLLNVTVGESTDNKGTDTDNKGTDLVTGLQIGLYDADSDTLIAPLTEGRQISESDIAGKSLTISALVTEESSFFGQVESMFLSLNNGQATRKENAEPYALFGDRNGNFLKGGSISSGNNTISFDLFSQDNLGGELLDTVNVDFTIL